MEHPPSSDYAGVIAARSSLRLAYATIDAAGFLVAVGDRIPAAEP